ncbi:hypothetical protein [Chitinophaga nivalis]|uniref:Uncharacterized protein n=1 Tax=Chitinophaga nivalis TaxID=2991709 RepID=A0ABT3IQ25_9BACT|nr:hypothetical protein [Chitinophaga nivalis]MCW3464238.1 hypothetical protein [Chitinophaga nivalis]MCW3486072.1 hypothetical protein [Chitinophaga nivalis]
MGKFIAYFDYLGYKSFIENCEPDRLDTRISHILRDIEMSMGNGKYIESSRGHLVADISSSIVHCLNISDTVIFSTKDDSKESLIELLEVAKKFNFQSNFYNMPVRGAILYDEYEMLSSQSKNEAGSTYSVNMIYGKGLVKVHTKAECLNWAGAVIDDSVISKIAETENVDTFLTPYAKKYPVPYKHEPYILEEYALKLLADGQNETSIENMCRNIKDSFARDNKPTESERVQTIIANTVAFVKSHN